MAQCFTRAWWLILLHSVALGCCGIKQAAAQTLATHIYGLAEGLPQSTVYSLAQDSRGRLWAGTQSGVCWFDGRHFKTFDTHQGLPDNHVTALLPAANGRMLLGHIYGAASVSELDENGHVRRLGPAGWRAKAAVRQLLPARDGGLWVATLGDGIYHIDNAPGGAARRLALPADTIFQLATGPARQLWAATTGGLVAFDAVTGGVVMPALPAALAGQRVYSIHRAADSLYWLGLESGLGRLWQPRPGAPWQLTVIGDKQGLCGGTVHRVLADRRQRVWALTSAGISRYEPGTGRALCFAQSNIISDQTAGGLLEDREGNLWVALYDGLLQHMADERFALYGAEEGLPRPDAQAVLRMGPGYYWVGTRDGLWEFRPEAPAGQRFRPGHQRPGGLAARFVRPLFRDSKGRIWMGSRGAGVAVYFPEAGRWQELSQIPGIAGQNIRAFTEDRLGRVWVATGGAGVTVVQDPATGAHRTYDARSSLGTNSFWTAFRDHRGTMWLGTEDNGLIRGDVQDNGDVRLARADGRHDRLSIGSITEDPAGRLWLGSIGEGLLRFDGQKLKAYGPENGLQSNNPYFVRSDARGRLWLGTNRGLDLFDPLTGQTRSYGPAEGFLGQETNQNAVLVEPNGELWVGTINGVMRYQPTQARRNTTPPHTYFTGVRVFGEDTTLAPGFRLPHNRNHLSLDFVGVSLTNPTKVRYQYRLVGFDAGWSRPGNATTATYTNLPPGDYTFEVKAANNDGVWNTAPTRLPFHIAAPWWRTWWAYLGYALLIGGAFYGVRRSTQQRERDRARQQLEYQALSHLQDMDRVKSDFFTHISHELRTPLTLILGPAEELVHDETLPEHARRQGRRISDNARKLLRLINQLLDLNKLDVGGLQLHPATADIAAEARQWLLGFQELAQSRQIGLHLAAPITAVPLVYDSGRLEEVVTNLLANALRFTPAGGHVTLMVQDEPASALAPHGTVVLSVQDTGVGIAAEHLPHLFDRFYQVPDAGPARTGSGVGLALVKELTERHGGTVQVLSTPGAGTTFVVRLPRGVLQPEHPEQAPAALPVAANAAVANALPEPAEDAEVVLVVDDSEEVRDYVRETLATAGYRMLEAADGPAGLALARTAVPSLVVSDVMMPGFDGFELCRQLKEDVATSHVPVVLLTGRTQAADRLAGLETGADAYLPKPFDPRELRAQVRNLLALRRRTQAILQPAVAATAPNAAPAAADPYSGYAAAVAALPSLDQCFLKRVEQAVERHLDNGELSVELLGEEVALSRAQLHRKLKALTGQAPSDFIRSLRLRRAHVLLAARTGSVSEIAYQVGFNSPAHFSTSFSREFGYAPSEVAAHATQA